MSYIRLPLEINDIDFNGFLDNFLHINFKLLHMPATNNQSRQANTAKSSKVTSYRGFASIDQEIEREIAMQWFNSSQKTIFSQRNYLLKKEEAV